MTDPRREAFERLAGEVWEPLQRYLLRRTDPDSAQDVLAETLLVLWRRVEDVPVQAPLPWSYGVARRCLANQRRGQERQLHLLARLAAEPDAPPPEQGSDALERALDALRPADRELLQLWAWEELAPREIAQVLGTSVAVVSVRLSRARSRLRTELDRAGPVAATCKDDGPAGQEQVEGTRRSTGG